MQTLHCIPMIMPIIHGMYLLWFVYCFCTGSAVLVVHEMTCMSTLLIDGIVKTVTKLSTFLSPFCAVMAKEMG